MKASRIEFRLRYLIHACVFALGFWAPWNRWLHLDGGPSSWLTLAVLSGRARWFSFDTATVCILVVAILFALSAAALRTWASAYLGASVVQDGLMRGAVLVTAGPYCYLRNPLYVGTMLHAIALSLLMPPSGAIFTVMVTALLQLRLIGGEEAFLQGSLGEEYALYCAQVPSLLPRGKAIRSASEVKRHWGQGFLGEVYMWGVALTFVILGWKYNAFLLTQGVVVSFGVSLVLSALRPRS